ncbi:uncharacterized protein J3D65DRAFT_658328 [Phyllosticta citribraziliensis]|uniref:BTB domain-containing protein n=1 Tax=Phyllosticta citribraziliensis TaxID=989973 RepID=A0ABR1LQR2_9PEZI
MLTFSSVLESGEYSDLEIRCSDDKYKVHKAIVCSQSEFFRLAIKPETGFKVGYIPTTAKLNKSNNDSAQEATSNVITLHETDPAVVRAVIQYLYSGSYESAVDIEGAFEVLMRHAHTYAAGEMYQIPGLKRAVCKKVEQLFPRVLRAKSLAIDQFSGFISAVYGTTVDTDIDLREVVFNHIAYNMKQVFGPGFTKAVEENPRFGVDMVWLLFYDRRPEIRALEDNLPTISYRCTACADVNDVEYGKVLQDGELRCSTCDAPRDMLVWRPICL